MTEVVLVSVVADGAEIVIGTLCALPSHAEDRLLATSVAHGALVFDASRSRVQDPQVERPSTAIVGRRAIVPDDNHLLEGLKVANGSHVALAAVLEDKSPG